MQSSLSSPFSVGMKLLFTPWTVLIVGNNLFTPSICKTMKTSSIRHLFGLGGWVGGSPPILSLFGFSEMSDNCRPPLIYFLSKTLKSENQFHVKMCSFTEESVKLVGKSEMKPKRNNFKNQSHMSFSPTAKLRIRPFSKGCRESGTNLIFLHRWGGKVDSRRFAMVVWDERCPFSCFRHFFGFGCHNHGNSLPMYVAPARRWSPVHSRRLHVLRRSFAKLIERRECVLFPSP